MADYTRIQNDTGRVINDTLQTDGSADDVTGATVAFTLWDADDGTLKVDENTANVTLSDAANGTVEYSPAANDFNTTGLFNYEWEVTFSGGTIVTYRASDGDPKTIRVKSEGS